MGTSGSSFRELLRHVLKSRLPLATPGQVLDFQKMYEIAAEYTRLAKSGRLPSRKG